jgi:glutamate synthase (NADPH/NADH) small chain
MDYLVPQNIKNAGEHLNAAEDIDAKGKRVVIIGGGDTGADCLGTAIRQGAKSVFQLEILPEPPLARPATMPWPVWPIIRRDATSHKEGGSRRWGVSATSFKGMNGCVSRVECGEVSTVRHADGRLEFVPRKGTEFELEADMVLMALGYVGPSRKGIMEDFHIECDRQGKIKTDEYHQTTARGVFVAGDMRGGPSLVVRAIADGISSAQGIMRWLKETG